jgi:hypothetical protein
MSPHPQGMQKRIVLAGGRLLPRALKSLIKRVWDPWHSPSFLRRVPNGQPLVFPVAEHPRYDILCFSIIDWSFRWQRPQQLMSHLADAGHRIFVFRPGAFFAPGGVPYQAVKLRDNVWEITIAPHHRATAGD